MAGERVGQGRKARWAEAANEADGGGGSFLESSREMSRPVEGGRAEGWQPRLVNGSRRSRQHTDSASTPSQEQGDLGKVREEKREKTVELPTPHLNGSARLGTEKGCRFSSLVPWAACRLSLWLSLPLLRFPAHPFPLFSLLPFSPPATSFWPNEISPC